jgi:hypothetical protein
MTKLNIITSILVLITQLVGAISSKFENKRNTRKKCKQNNY